MQILEQSVWAIGVGLLVGAILGAFSYFSPFWIGLSSGISSLLTFIYLIQNQAHRILTEKTVASYLNLNYTQLEDSAFLLLEKKENLGSLSQLQQAKTIQTFETIKSKICLPHRLYQAFIFLFLTTIFLFASWNLPDFLNSNQASVTIKEAVIPAVETSKEEKLVKAPIPQLIAQSIQVFPPTYTNLKSWKADDFKDLKVMEGSQVKWTLHFDSEIQNCQLNLNNRDFDLKTSEQKTFTISKTLTKNGFYHFAYMLNDTLTQYSDYFTYQIKEDLPPTILIPETENYQSIPYDSLAKFSTQWEAKDDFGLSKMQLHTLVSRGSGENMIFKDSTFHFKTHGKTHQQAFDILLKNLAMQAGDELYWYVSATDNKSPNPQQTKSNTYIIALEDTVVQASIVSDRLGVDRMPAYFRSQRQIIIDTEKLLAEKKDLDPTTFKNKSNSIGIDQKILRLRYGKFLGEEFESSSGGHASHDHSGHDHKEHNHPHKEHDHNEEHQHDENCEHYHEKHEHQHDENCEHNHEEHEHQHDENCEHNHEEHAHHHEEHEPQATTEEHEHHHHHEITERNEDGEAVEDLLEPFVHFHDAGEEATLFDDNIKTKLRAALNEMWQAELHLRMHQPQLALPYENRALKLLKEVQQSSRIYVERVGFEAPKLKMEKRWSGELEDIESQRFQTQNKKPKTYPHIKKAIQSIENLLEKEDQVNNDFRQNLLAAGDELAIIITEKGKPYLKALKFIKSIENGVNVKDISMDLKYIQRVLSQAISLEDAPLAKKPKTTDLLEEVYLKKIGKF